MARSRPSIAPLPCQQRDPDLWFADSPVDVEFAKALCADCPLRAECLAGALGRREPAGVWGGELFDHGSIISHKRARGRPSKRSKPPVRYPICPVTVCRACDAADRSRAVIGPVLDGANRARVMVQTTASCAGAT